ncbi:MAG: hypothetical protein K2W95_03575 [Candidatus Obscuribacterales bacterium]|nr:hypothetical protein [Candidatus Obscuribacterales bacterium]
MIYALFGGKTSHCRMVKNAAHWAAADDETKIELSFQKIRKLEASPVVDLDTSTRIDSAVRRFTCLNDVFAELIEDNQAMGLSA